MIFQVTFEVVLTKVLLRTQVFWDVTHLKGFKKTLFLTVAGTSDF
jgi:hypothetical protein